MLAGPTASGKTAVAESLARLVGGEILSCDSMQVYRAMPIVTQAPRRRAGGRKTHLVGFLDPSEEYSAALFRRDAESLIRRLLSKGKLPIVTGGTGLYLRALLDGLFETGAVSKDEALRRRLHAEAEIHGAPALHTRLAGVDPGSAARIHPNDLRRVVRALEVLELTRRPLSAQRAERRGLRDELPHRLFLIERDRQDLYRRIDSRVDAMFRTGLVREVRRLARRPLSKTAGMALGIRQVRDHLEGGISLEEARELLKRETRRYAKRQLSWFRHERGMEPLAVGPDERPSETARRIRRLWREAA